MFNELVESTTGRKAGRRSWTIAVSMALQTAGVLVLILMPLLYTQALPKGFLNFTGTLFTPISTEPVPTPAKVPSESVKRASFFKDGVLHQPPAIPPRVTIFQEAALPPELPADANNAGRWGGDLFSYLGDGRTEVPRPPEPIRIQRIRQSSIQPAMILAQPQPVYPPPARNARIQGDVVLHAVIDKEGRVAELRVVSGSPWLFRAAMEAVQNWRYRPTLLNGEPVEVETTITLSFVLGG